MRILLSLIVVLSALAPLRAIAQEDPCVAPDTAFVMFLCELTSRDTAVVAQVLAKHPEPDGSIWVLTSTAYAGFMDWKTESGDAITYFNVLLERRGLPPISAGEAVPLTEKGEAMWGKSVPLEYIGPEMEKRVEAAGARLLYIDTGSDSYGYAIVSPAFFDRWVGVALSEYVRLSPLSADVQRLDYGNTKRWRSRPLGAPVYQ